MTLQNRAQEMSSDIQRGISEYLWNAPVAELSGVTKRFGKTVALDDLNLDVPRIAVTGDEQVGLHIRADLREVFLADVLKDLPGRDDVELGRQFLDMIGPGICDVKSRGDITGEEAVRDRGPFGPLVLVVPIRASRTFHGITFLDLLGPILFDLNHPGQVENRKRAPSRGSVAF